MLTRNSGDHGEIKMLLNLQIKCPILFNFSLHLRIDVNDIMVDEERPAEHDVEARIFGQVLIDPELDPRREVDRPDVEIEIHVFP